MIISIRILKRLWTKMFVMCHFPVMILTYQGKCWLHFFKLERLKQFFHFKIVSVFDYWHFNWQNHISLIDDIFDCLSLILKIVVVFWMSGVFLRVSHAVFQHWIYLASEDWLSWTIPLDFLNIIPLISSIYLSDWIIFYSGYIIQH